MVWVTASFVSYPEFSLLYMDAVILKPTGCGNCPRFLRKGNSLSLCPVGIDRISNGIRVTSFAPITLPSNFQDISISVPNWHSTNTWLLLSSMQSRVGFQILWGCETSPKGQREQTHHKANQRYLSKDSFTMKTFMLDLENGVYIKHRLIKYLSSNYFIIINGPLDIRG